MNQLSLDPLKRSGAILIVGGAGYIGSHMVAYAYEHDLDVVVLDNLSSGHRDAVPDHVPFYEGDLSDRNLLDRVFKAHTITAVMHFAAHIEVAESVQHPAKYYHNNVAKTLVLLDAMVVHDVKRLIFSSTAAVYGEPTTESITEDHPKQPINPYGASKWMVEQVLQDYAKAYGLQSVALRYFNASGAHPLGYLAERHQPETHLIPLLLEVAMGRRQQFYQYGDDYPTPDGSCVRDFIHVMDLCEAHALALLYLHNGGETRAFNVGSSSGFSVKAVIEAARRVTGHAIPVEVHPRRAGDPATLIADAASLRACCGWRPHYDDLYTIISQAWVAQQHWWHSLEVQ